MKKKNKQERINEAIRLLNNRYRIEYNSVRINCHNTIEHELAKTKLCYELIKDGYTIITEAIFLGDGRGDIFVPEKFRVYEILHTETKEEALKKTQKYPKELEIFYKTSEEILNMLKGKKQTW